MSNSSDQNNQPVPSARSVYRGDINDAVIKVQKSTGIEISPAWWNDKVGNNGTAEQILDRFDRAYKVYVEQQRK